jgi:hypothetical protein
VKVAIITSLFTKRNMNINARHVGYFCENTLNERQREELKNNVEYKKAKKLIFFLNIIKTPILAAY